MLISSFAALLVYMQQAKIMREQTDLLIQQTKANAWPHLTIEVYRGFGQKGLHTFKMQVLNKGVGPAILEQTRISYDGTYLENWDEFFDVIIVPDSISISYSNNNINERVIASNETLELIDWSNYRGESTNTPLMNYIDSKTGKIQIEICYKSIHGEQFSVRRTGFKTDLEVNERNVGNICNSNGTKVFLH